jgi:hypothetical protein
MTKPSGRKRKSKIFRLCQDEGVIEGDKNILIYATCFYKKIFGPVELLPVSMDVPLSNDLDEEDKLLLTRPFSLEEIKDAVFSMKHWFFY